MCCVEIHTDDPQIISSAYGVNLDSRMVDEILCIFGQCDMPLQLLKSVLSSLQIGTMIDSFNSCGNSSLFVIELISLWILERIVLPLL